MGANSRRIGHELKVAPVPWAARQKTLRSVARPSWIGRIATPPPPNHASNNNASAARRMSERPASPSMAPPPANPAGVSRMSEPPPASRGSNSRPAMGSGSFAAMARQSVIPPQMIQTTREVELEAEVEGLRLEVARLAQTIATMRTRILEESEPEILRFCVAIADRVVAREITQDPSVIMEWIREGLAALPGREDIVVAVAPDIASLIAAVEQGQEEQALQDGTKMPRGSKTVVDATLRPGTIELREGNTSAEISAQTRMAAIAEALGVDTTSAFPAVATNAPADGGGT